MEERRTAFLSFRRVVLLAAVILLIFLVFAVRLYGIQITEHEEYVARSRRGYTLTLPIPAARGEILDRDLTPLVVNRTAYAVVFDYNYYPAGSSEAARSEQNGMLLELCGLLTAAGESWNDTLPVTRETPYAFSEGREQSVAALKSRLLLAEYATADNCMDALIRRYRLEGYAPPEQRTLAGVQYEMEVREFGAFSPFTFASGVSKETSYLISENAARFPGADVQTVARRDWVSGEIAPHLIGTVGPMYAEDYALLKDKGYALNDTLGKSGAEQAFEDRLRGKAGSRVLIKDHAGVVTDSYENLPPSPGDTVVLTLDSRLQWAAQQALAEQIEALRQRPATSGGKFLNNGHDVASGSVVVLDTADGGILAAASWPWYDLAAYREKYEELVSDPDKPLFNRALNGAFACGSTMKPGVALAALNEGVITPASAYSCGGSWNRFAPAGLILHCLGHHGSINVVTALQKSCNVFFYETGMALGIEKMNEYSAAYGLGQITGVEVGESAGVLAGPAHSQAVGTVWTQGSTATAAIGQSDNMFTPLQLAVYASTLANDGVRYRTHLLHSCLGYDGSVTAYEPAVEQRLTLSREALETVRRGMVAVGQSGTAATQFRSAPYTVACKTGTAQVSASVSDHGVFIAYAPAENPAVAVAVVMENGTSAAASAVARQVLDAWFLGTGEGETDPPAGQLLP